MNAYPQHIAETQNRFGENDIPELFKLAWMCAVGTAGEFMIEHAKDLCMVAAEKNNVGARVLLDIFAAYDIDSSGQNYTSNSFYDLIGVPGINIDPEVTLLFEYCMDHDNPGPITGSKKDLLDFLFSTWSLPETEKKGSPLAEAILTHNRAVEDPAKADEANLSARLCDAARLYDDLDRVKFHGILRPPFAPPSFESISEIQDQEGYGAYCFLSSNVKPIQPNPKKVSRRKDEMSNEEQMATLPKGAYWCQAIDNPNFWSLLENKASAIGVSETFTITLRKHLKTALGYAAARRYVIENWMDASPAKINGEKESCKNSYFTWINSESLNKNLDSLFALIPDTKIVDGLVCNLLYTETKTLLSAICEVLTSVSKNPETGAKAGVDLMVNYKKQIAVLKVFLPENIPLCSYMCDFFAIAVAHCFSMYMRGNGNLARCFNPWQKLEPYCSTKIVKRLVEGFLSQQVERLIKQCWFCASNSAESGCEAFVPLHRVKSSTCEKVEFETCKIPVPRCSECSKEHNRILSWTPATFPWYEKLFNGAIDQTEKDRPSVKKDVLPLAHAEKYPMITLALYDRWVLGSTLTQKERNNYDAQIQKQVEWTAKQFRY